jgi:hypothetical protein
VNIIESAKNMEKNDANDVLVSCHQQLMDHVKKHEMENTGNAEYEAELSIALNQYQSGKLDYHLKVLLF